jgi:hypothetical protein
VNEQTKLLLKAASDYAIDLLDFTGEFYPFGVFINEDNKVDYLEFEPDKKNMPTIGKVITFLENELNLKLKNKEIVGFGIVYEVAIQLDKNAPKTDAIAVDIKFLKEKTPIFYYPYSLQEDEKIVYDEVFAVERN